MKRLLYLRKKNKLTQHEISKVFNIPRSTYAHYEMGKRQPDFDTLKMMANYFDVTIDYLLEHSDIPHPDRVLTRDEIAAVLGEEAGKQLDEVDARWFELIDNDVKGNLTVDELRDLVRFAIKYKDEQEAKKAGFKEVDY